MDTVDLEGLDSLRGGWHVCTLGNEATAVFDQQSGGFATQLVLNCARECDIGFELPDAAALVELSTLSLSGVLGGVSTTDFLDFL